VVGFAVDFFIDICDARNPGITISCDALNCKRDVLRSLCLLLRWCKTAGELPVLVPERRYVLVTIETGATSPP